MYPQVECIEDCGNGYGWSIIEMGGDRFELAVLQDRRIVYHTPITGDVERGSWADMRALTERIRSLR
jgi:hypothetical protein